VVVAGMTAIRECYVGDRTCNGLVADDGTVVALIADEKLTKLLGVCPVAYGWERYWYDGRVVCARYNGRDYDLADVQDIGRAEVEFALKGWKGDEDFVRALDPAGE
jgi:hypothetical protein